MGTRAFRASALAVSTFALMAAAPSGRATTGSEAARENQLPGTTAWQAQPPPHPAIEAYASETSVTPGGSFHLHVAAHHAGDRYRIVVYRLGWYGGAGGRVVACLPACTSDELAAAQPAPAPPARRTGEVRARWSVTDVLQTGGAWVDGYYLAQLLVTAGPDAGAVGRLPLVVRAPAGDRAAMLVQVPVNTWQAYNGWGGKSLYPDNSTHHKAAVKVSFDRPYAQDVPIKVPFMLELPAVQFLEREGYDVSYVTDADVDADPHMLLRHRVVVSIGHDEYWTHAMRLGWGAALRASTNLTALGANAAYWQARYEDHRRTLVEYRRAARDPVKSKSLHTIEFRKLVPPLPECALFGVDYAVNAQRTYLGAPTDYTVAAAASDPWLAGSGLARGDVVRGVVGYEWDGPRPHCFQGHVTELLTARPRGEDGAPHGAAAVRAVARSGARVFATGSHEFSWGLATSPGLAQLARNAFADLLRPAAPRRLEARRRHGGIAVTVALRARDPRVRETLVYRHAGSARFDPSAPGATLVCDLRRGRTCRDRPPAGAVRYAAVTVDEWGRSAPMWSAVA